ncbi:hypothetical protein [Nocardioides sp.]|uniref:hypothetical protein n=1 Tax=Nocardioides sp. TaxID=35761 RepID=UPI003D0C53B9
MNENYPLGPALTFVPDEDVDVAFAPAPISKADARSIGLAFCEASDGEREAMLADLDPKMVRRSLLVFANLAARLGEPDAAAYARDLRAAITFTKVRAL